MDNNKKPWCNEHFKRAILSRLSQKKLKQMKEQLITLETAKLAKEKGFNIKTHTAFIGEDFFETQHQLDWYGGWDLAQAEDWNEKGWIYSKDGNKCFGCKLDNIKYFEACSAPTQSLLQKWLREVHKIYIFVEPTLGDDAEINFAVFATDEFQTDLNLNLGYETSYHVSTYEEALEKGLQEALKLILKK